MWIGIISDTYGNLHSHVLDIFDGVDYILHCGNIGSLEVVEELSQLAPTAGVCGPVDDEEVFPFKRTLHRKLLDVGLYVIHHLGDPVHLSRALQEELRRLEPEVVLFGKVQGPFNNRIEGRLFFNPGPAGRRRSRFPRSVGILEIEGLRVRGEVIPLDKD